MAVYTLEDIETNLLEYADYEAEASVSRAKSLVTWANRWLIKAPQSASNQSSSQSFDTAAVERIKNRALAFIAANDTTNTTSRLHYNCFTFEGYDR